MQQLHLIGFTTDHSGLIFTTSQGSGSDGFIVAVDDALLRSIDEIRDGGRDPAPVQPTEGAQATAGAQAASLTPRDVQDRLRMGQSAAEIADDAGVDEAWVERFAGPVMAERAQVVARALEMVYGQPKSRARAVPLGRLVADALADRGVRIPEDVFASSWTTFHLAGSRWAVRFSYLYRQRQRVAEWEVDLRSGSLRARNRTASDLSRPAALAAR